MRLAIFSDDLTGASGVGSMIKTGRTITVNYENLPKIDLDRFDNVSINLNLRDANPQTTRKLMRRVLSVFREKKIALRIDSALRGNIAVMIKTIIAVRCTLITDTIPEYGRYTENETTFFDGEGKNILELLNIQNGDIRKQNLIISDSFTGDDLDALAENCLKMDLVPIDPGPMIARYAIKLGKINETREIR